jgi:hypothetical protein
MSSDNVFTFPVKVYAKVKNLHKLDTDKVEFYVYVDDEKVETMKYDYNKIKLDYYINCGIANRTMTKIMMETPDNVLIPLYFDFLNFFNNKSEEERNIIMMSYKNKRITFKCNDERFELTYIYI